MLLRCSGVERYRKIYDASRKVPMLFVAQTLSASAPAGSHAATIVACRFETNLKQSICAGAWLQVIGIEEKRKCPELSSHVIVVAVGARSGD